MMTRFANKIGRIYVTGVDREAFGGLNANVGYMRASTHERFSRRRRNEDGEQMLSRTFDSVSVAFQSACRLPLVIPMVAAGSYVRSRCGRGAR